jgi:copper chaperone CopZ
MTEDWRMEFHIELVGAAPDMDAVKDAVQTVDPAALVDIDPSGRELRVATSVESAELISLIRQAGYAVEADQVSQVPSTCCGGCSG